MVISVISFVTTLQIWISAGHVTEIITMKDQKFNWQLNIRKVKDASALFPFYSLFYNQKFVWGNFRPLPGTIGLILHYGHGEPIKSWY